MADWIEQVQGAAKKENPNFRWREGEAYAYRKMAFAQMVDILTHKQSDRLGHIVKEIYANVYGTEGSSTRNSIQPCTPPQTKAAKLALEALRSAGENIPVDFAPQPVGDQNGDTCSQDTSTVKESMGKFVSNVYETDDLLGMHLGLHYPLSGSKQNFTHILHHDNSPIHGLRFPQRVAELLISLHPVRTNNRSLDVGCSVGGSSFELSKSFDHVEAFDFSKNFIAAAKCIQKELNMTS